MTTVETPHQTTRDYSLTGPSRDEAIANGLADAAWFQPNIDPAKMRSLQVRTDRRATLDTLLWLALIAGSGTWAFVALGSWWCVPPFIVYGALLGGAGDARWHECGHGTAFKTAWANDVVYYFASFNMWRGPTVWRWSHYRHHTDTIIVGRDAEIAFPRPANVWRAAFTFTHLKNGPLMLWRLVRHSAGSIDDDARELVPEGEIGKVVWESRIFVAILAGVTVWSVAIGSIVPLLFIGLPAIYGGWLLLFFAITQHAGLREDVLDHRYSTRTVLMNPVFRFLYLNMNYHLEHHIFPSVPYRQLPKLHREIADQLPPARPSTWAAYREIWTTLWRQQHDPSYELGLEVPAVDAERRRIDVGEDNWTSVDDGVVDLGASDQLAIGELRRLDVDGHVYVLGRLDDGRAFLVDGICTHQHVELCEGAVVGCAIECPKHNGRFDAITGEATRKPVTKPLAVYDLSERGGRLSSTLSEQSTTVPGTDE